MANDNDDGKNTAAIITDPVVAAAEGRLDLFTSENSPFSKNKICDDVNIIIEAANNGHLEVLAWLYELIYKTNKIEQKIESHWWCDAAFRGHLDCIKFLVDNGEPIHEWTIIYAAQGGQIEIVKYLKTQNCEITTEAITGAADYGELAMLAFLFETHSELFSRDVVIEAANARIKDENVHLECLEYLYEVAPQHFDVDALNSAILRGNASIEAFLIGKPQIRPDYSTFATAVKCDRVGIMQGLYKDPEIAAKVARDHKLMWKAAELGMEDATRFLLEIGAPATQRAVNRAAKQNRASILRMLYESKDKIVNFDEARPVEIGAECMLMAVRNSSPDAIKFLYDIGVPCLDRNNQRIEADSADELIRHLLATRMIYLNDE